MGTKAKKKAAAKAPKQSKTDKLRETREAAHDPGKPKVSGKRQPELAGFERKTDQELDDLGRSYDE
jgi:hypothetical protein